MRAFRLAALLALAPALLGWAEPGRQSNMLSGPAHRVQAVKPPPAGVEQGADAAGARLVALFSRFCLQRFPDQPDLAQGETAMTPMPPGMIQRYLHADPGRGWVNHEDGDTVVTIEDPPYHACAVRRMYPAAPRFDRAYQGTIMGWAESRNRGEFGPPRTARQQRPTMNIEATVQTLPAARGRPAENFMAFTTTYPSGNVEIRLVRQIPDPRLMRRQGG